MKPLTFYHSEIVGVGISNPEPRFVITLEQLKKDNPDKTEEELREIMHKIADEFNKELEDK